MAIDENTHVKLYQISVRTQGWQAAYSTLCKGCHNFKDGQKTGKAV